MRARHLNGVLIVAILLISTAPLYAQRQQQNVAKLKEDARNAVGIIGGDKAKTQTYCQIIDLGRQMNQGVGEKDQKKARAFGTGDSSIPETSAGIHRAGERRQSCRPKFTRRSGNRLNNSEPQSILCGLATIVQASTKCAKKIVVVC